MKYLLQMLSFSLLIFSSCAERKTPVVTYTLKHSDYLETIEVNGTVQAVNNLTLVTPRVNSSGLKVIYLAKDGAPVKKGDTICIVESSDLLGNLESLKQDLSKMEAELRSLEADNALQLSMLEAQVETNKAQMEITMLDSIQMKFAPPVKQKLLALEMEKVGIEKTKLTKKLDARKRISTSGVLQIQSRIMMQKNLVQMFQAQVNSLFLVSPADGFAMHVEGPTFYTGGGSTIGGKIEEGSRVFQSMGLIQIPDITKMQVSVEVPESDYKRINNDQKVIITVEAAGNLMTTGKINRKSPAVKRWDEPSEVKVYEVIISVDSCHLKMKPGLSASCSIIIDRVQDTVVVPSAAIFTKDSLKIVYVSHGEKFIPVTVETGLSGSSSTIISKGLSGDETIALLEPPHNLILQKDKKAEDKNVTSESSKNDSINNRIK